MARKLIFEIDQANERVDDDSCKRIFESADNGQAIDLFDL